MLRTQPYFVVCIAALGSAACEPEVSTQPDPPPAHEVSEAPVPAKPEPARTAEDELEEDGPATPPSPVAPAPSPTGATCGSWV